MIIQICDIYKLVKVIYNSREFSFKESTQRVYREFMMSSLLREPKIRVMMIATLVGAHGESARFHSA